MAATEHDVIVLGAGIVGVATALHLQARGSDVVLIDRQPPGKATSYGNAGLIQRDAIVPYMMPLEISTILDVARGRSPLARVHYSALLKIAPWLLAYWWNSGKAGLEKGSAAMLPLVAKSVEEHAKLMEEAGCSDMLRRTGYLRLHRDTEDLDKDEAEQKRLNDAYGITYSVYNPDQLEDLEPHLREEFVGAILMPEVASLANPEALTTAYGELFKARGGRLATGDAMTLEAIGGDGPRWQVQNIDGPIRARDAVITLGPWSGDVLAKLGIKVPLGVKRGYHMHFGAQGNATLNRPLLDVQNGFILTPMERGLRLTTGAEFALRDAKATPVQLDQLEPIAREMFPLGERVDDHPWLGSRPCFPDMIPAIGQVPGRKGLWANFGHNHLGLTMAATTGRLVAELVTGDETHVNPAPYRLDRF